MKQNRPLRTAVVVTALLLLLGLAGGTALLLGRQQATARAGADESVERIARIVESTVNRHFLAVDGVLAGLPAVLTQLARDDRLEPVTANRMLRDLGFQNFNFRDLLLLQADGRPWATALPASRGRAPPILPTELVDPFPDGAVSIVGPVRNGLTGEWSLFFVRQITLPGPGDLFAVAEVPVSLIGTLLAAVSDADGLSIRLERNDGRVLTRLPTDESWMARARVPDAAVPAANGVAVELDGAISVARPTLYNGITVVVSLERDAALAGWREDRDRLLLAGAGTGVLLVALALALNLAMRQRERIEAVRARARAVLESAIESMPDGFVMFDAEDRLVICNTRYRDLYSVTAPFIRPGVPFKELIREGARRGQYPQAGVDLEAFIAATSAWHRGDHPPIERLLPDGRWILVTERRMPAGGTVGIRTDITALKRAMAELAQARDAAAAATEAKSRFLGRMSHELRTPLNGVLGIAQALAANAQLPEDARAEARTLEMAGRHLLAVANDVLDLAKVEAGRLELHPTSTALAPLLEECAAILRPAAAEKRVALSLTLDPALPRHVAVDATRLRQLVLNLLTNAIKFTPEAGDVTLLAAILPPLPEAAANPQPLLRIEVRDTGPGVPEAARDAVFGDFVQLDRATAATGAGLGLAIAAHIVERMEGRIGCAANDRTPDGTGALFWAELPLTVSAPVLDTGAPKVVAPTPGAMRLLVVDDVPANLAVARALLDSAGHAIHCVMGGADAVALLAAPTAMPFDAVLMDVMMPGMDGLEATRRIRALSSAAARVPIVALTASVFAEDVAACLAAGMDAHVAKPIDREALLTVLTGLVQKSRAAASPPPAETTPQATRSRQAGAPAREVALEPPLLGQARATPPALRGLDPAATARLSLAFEAELVAAGAALAAATEPAPIAAAAHRLAGAAATLDAPRLLLVARRLHSMADAPQADPATAIMLAAAAAPIVTATLAALEDTRHHRDAA